MDALASESRRGFAALLLRGGRLTKLAGEVASFAPALGGAAVALLSSLSVPVAGILGGAFLGLTAQQAMACGFTGEKWTCGNRTSTLTDSAPRAGLLVDELRVDVVNNATINVSSGLAFDLTHTGSGGIHWEHIGRAIVGSPHKEVTGGTGVIEATNSGGGNIRIIAKATLKATVNTTTVASTTVPVVKVVNSGNGHIDLDFTAVTSSRRNGHAIWVKNDGSGKTDITATGAITAGTGWGYGLYVRGGVNGNANTSLNISVASVTGFQRGMYIKHKGRGNVSISATGAVTSAGTAAGDSNSGNDAIRVINDDHASDIKVTAATVTARGTGGGDNGIYVHQQHGGTVEISASGPVTTGGGHGIFVKQDGNDAVTINVTGSVTGDDDDNESAIKVEAGANDAVTVNLNSGAVVGSANEDAVVETGGNATVSVKSGAEVKGAIKLGGGNDKVILSGGTAGGSIDFGAGIDTLEVSTSGSLSMPTASNFETLELKDNVDVSSAIAISRSGSDALNVTLASGTDVSVNQGAAFTLNRTSGSGNIIFTQAEGGQRLTGRQGVINVTNSGSGNIWITATGQLRLDNRLRTGSAVKAFNENTSGGFIVVSVNSIDITEAGRNSNAIEVKNEGTGPISITATGNLEPITLGGGTASMSEPVRRTRPRPPRSTSALRRSRPVGWVSGSATRAAATFSSRRPEPSQAQNEPTHLLRRST